MRTSFFLFIGALIARLAVLIFYPDQHFPDAESYLSAADTLRATGEYTLHYHMPLYVLWTMLWKTPILIKVADCIVSSLSVILIYKLALTFFKKRRIALFSSLIAMIYPHFLFYATSRLTESLYIFLLLLALLYLYKERFFWASILLTLGVLTRPTLDLLNPVLIITFAYFIHRYSFKETLKKLGLFLITYAVIMSPWWVYNFQRYDHFVRLNIGEGFGLYSGNNPHNKTGGGVVDPDYGVHDLDISPCAHIKNYYAFNQCLKKEALQFMKENPQRVLKLMGMKFVRFWRLWPFTQHYQNPLYIVGSLLSYGVVLLLALLSLIYLHRNQWRLLTPVWMLITYMTIVHMVLISSIRYRLPLEPFLIILTAFSINHLIASYERRRDDAHETT